VTAYPVLLVAIVVRAVFCVATNGVVTRTWQKRIEAGAAQEHFQVASMAPRTCRSARCAGRDQASYVRALDLTRHRRHRLRVNDVDGAQDLALRSQIAYL
jgi:hypothetical protein